MPIPHVIEARPLGGHRVWLRFDDGAAGRALLLRVGPATESGALRRCALLGLAPATE